MPRSCQCTQIGEILLFPLFLGDAAMAAGVRAPALTQMDFACRRAVSSPTGAAGDFSQVSSLKCFGRQMGRGAKNDAEEGQREAPSGVGDSTWGHGMARARPGNGASPTRAFDRAWGCPPAGLKVTCHALPEVMLAAQRKQRGGGGGERSTDRGRQPVWREMAAGRKESQHQERITSSK